MTATVPSTDPQTFGQAFDQLRQAQKNNHGAPPYSRFVNRPVGRVFAAAAYRLGMTPNQVTAVSGLFTFAGIVVLAVAPATWLVGVLVALLLMIGYALDSADGQLARLRHGGSPVGEWLDHMIDSAKLATLHLAVLITFYRHFDLPHEVWLLVPLVFSAVQVVQFFGMLLTDLIAREHHAAAAPGTPFSAPSKGPGVGSTVRTLLRLPTDYGLACLAFLLLGVHQVFFVVYALMALAWVAFLLLGSIRWYRMVDALGRS